MWTRAREESEQANARGRRSTRLSSREKGDRREAESIWSGVVVLRDTERAPGIPDAVRDSWYWCRPQRNLGVSTQRVESPRVCVWREVPLRQSRCEREEELRGEGVAECAAIYIARI